MLYNLRCLDQMWPNHSQSLIKINRFTKSIISDCRNIPPMRCRTTSIKMHFWYLLISSLNAVRLVITNSFCNKATSWKLLILLRSSKKEWLIHSHQPARTSSNSSVNCIKYMKLATDLCLSMKPSLSKLTDAISKICIPLTLSTWMKSQESIIWTTR